ncbi:regucalcin-like isoform X1 [Bacillus rossius redtenbacheri]
MAVNIKRIGHPTHLGEGPQWSPEEQVLYYTDILESSIFRYDPKTNTETSIKLGGGNLSIVIPVEGKKNQFVITLERNIAVLTWDGNSPKPEKLEIISSVEKLETKCPTTNFNDGKADPVGRLWAGTLEKGGYSHKTIPEQCALYNFSKDGTPTLKVSGITLSNGMAWSSDKKTMYYTDTPTFKIFAFDYDAPTGNITNRRVVFDMYKDFLTEGPDGKTVGPDGMTIDSEDKLWLATFGSSKVLRIDPATGKVISTVTVPSPEVTSVAFGGKNLDELYVTSANILNDTELTKKYPDAGYTFRVTGLGVKGLPAKNVILSR